MGVLPILERSKMSLDVTVLVIGAGPSGIGLAAQLIRQYSMRDFELIEKANDVGGTWFSNTYPGCGCDVIIRISLGLNNY